MADILLGKVFSLGVIESEDLGIRQIDVLRQYLGNIILPDAWINALLTVAVDRKSVV